MSQEILCYSERIKEWPFIPPCKRKRIWLISQATISMIYFANTSALCAEVETGNCFFLPGWSRGGEWSTLSLHVRMRQHRRRPLLTMDPGQGFKIAARSPGGAHDPATHLENTHTLLQSSGFISPGPTSYVQNYDLITALMFNTFVLHQHIDDTWFSKCIICISQHASPAVAFRWE